MRGQRILLPTFSGGSSKWVDDVEGAENKGAQRNTGERKMGWFEEGEKNGAGGMERRIRRETFLRGENYNENELPRQNGRKFNTALAE